MTGYIDVAQMTEAFRKQVTCDYEFLKKLFMDKTINPSHRAHLFQMCLEKFAKYTQLKLGNQINKQHNWVSKILPHLFEKKYGNAYSANSLKKVYKDVKSLCREIDLLAPAHYGVDKQNPVNCEYPWEIADVNGKNPRAFVPCEYKFAIFSENYQPIIKEILVMIESEI